MKKSYHIACSVMGIIGAVLIIAGAVIEDSFPRPLWLAASICMLANDASLVMNCRNVRKDSALRENTK